MFVFFFWDIFYYNQVCGFKIEIIKKSCLPVNRWGEFIHKIAQSHKKHVRLNFPPCIIFHWFKTSFVFHIPMLHSYSDGISQLLWARQQIWCDCPWLWCGYLVITGHIIVTSVELSALRGMYKLSLSFKMSSIKKNKIKCLSWFHYNSRVSKYYVKFQTYIWHYWRKHSLLKMWPQIYIFLWTNN